MNPWFEEHWPGVHARLIAYLADAISEKLPDDLKSLPEEGVSISADGCDDGTHRFRSDVVVRKSWQQGEAPSWSPEDRELQARAAVPTIVQVPPMTERWIEIRDSAGLLVTVIEILSPGNKAGSGLSAYLEKRRMLLESAISLVEIDLLLGGSPVFPESYVHLPPLAAAHYFINVKRVGNEVRREIYRPLLRDPLPVIRIPLRKDENDVLVDLQPLVDQVFAAGRYHTLNYSRLPDLPMSAEDQQWLREKIGA